MPAQPVTQTIYSIGYEGRSLDDLLATLKQHRVRTLVDVRLTPISRRPGFSKSALSRALNREHIQYVHERSLGNPPQNRPDYRAGKPRGRLCYERHLEGADAQAALERVATLVRQQRTALLCLEHEHALCHRASVTARLAEADAFEVVGL